MFTVSTTIGYGTFAPVTEAGQWFTVFMAFAGISSFIRILHQVSLMWDYFADRWTEAYASVRVRLWCVCGACVGKSQLWPPSSLRVSAATKLISILDYDTRYLPCFRHHHNSHRKSVLTLKATISLINGVAFVSASAAFFLAVARLDHVSWTYQECIYFRFAGCTSSVHGVAHCCGSEAAQALTLHSFHR